MIKLETKYEEISDEQSKLLELTQIVAQKGMKTTDSEISLCIHIYIPGKQ